jgi:hypothetical protein
MTQAKQTTAVDHSADLLVFVERVTRIELALSAWEADVLPLNYTRAWPERLLRAGAPARQTDLPRHRTG